MVRFGDLQNERFRDEATFGAIQAVLQNTSKDGLDCELKKASESK